MADFTLDIGSIEESFDYPILISSFEDQSEQRRTVTDKRMLGFKVTSPVLTKAGWTAYKSFYTSKLGGLTKFTFESPIDETTYTVRFVPGSFTTKFGGGLRVCSFELKVLDEEEV